METRVEATRYTVTVMPEDSVNRYHYDLTVERRAPGQWAICWMRFCLSADGTWDYEPLPSERSDEWKAAHRFDLDTALELAKQTAPNLAVNGMTPAECRRWEQNQRSKEA